MSDENMKEAFEAWAWENRDPHFPDFSKDESDDRMYWGRVTEIAWQAWQAALSLDVPEGWKLVPIEPTADMLKRSNWSGNRDVSVDEEWARKTVYRRMLSAAPEAPEE